MSIFKRFFPNIANSIDLNKKVNAQKQRIKNLKDWLESEKDRANRLSKMVNKLIEEQIRMSEINFKLLEDNKNLKEQIK